MTSNPLAQKLGIKPSNKVAVLNIPADYTLTFPNTTLFTEPQTKTCNVVLAFAPTRAELTAIVPAAQQSMKAGGILWFAYPKKSAGLGTDLSRESCWEVLRAFGLHPVSQVAIDSIWTALRFKAN